MEITRTRVRFWRLKGLRGYLWLLLARACGHQCLDSRPVLGYLVAGEVRCPIHQVTFETVDEITGQGGMKIRATAAASTTGAVGGRNRIEAEDGTLCWLSPVARPPGYFGVKTQGCVWEFTFDCQLEPPGGWVSEDQARRNLRNTI